jgi:hypothetical protein
MVSNIGGNDIGALAERYRGSLGHLYSPGAQRGPWEFLPYGLDNGAYAMWTRNLDWKEAPWLRLLDWAAKQEQRPLWAVVPDSVADRDGTIERWWRYVGAVRERGIRPAFAVQDGMTFDDVPSDDCVLFLGGTTGWKNAAIAPWCSHFPGRVHVARVTEGKRLRASYEAGAVSVDGNGWHRKTAKPGSRPQFDVLKEFLLFQAERKAA